MLGTGMWPFRFLLFASLFGIISGYHHLALLSRKASTDYNRIVTLIGFKQDHHGNCFINCDDAELPNKFSNNGVYEEYNYVRYVLRNVPSYVGGGCSASSCYHYNKILEITHRKHAVTGNCENKDIREGHYSSRPQFHNLDENKCYWSQINPDNCIKLEVDIHGGVSDTTIFSSSCSWFDNCVVAKHHDVPPSYELRKRTLNGMGGGSSGHEQQGGHEQHPGDQDEPFPEYDVDNDPPLTDGTLSICSVPSDHSTSFPTTVHDVVYCTTIGFATPVGWEHIPMAVQCHLNSFHRPAGGYNHVIYGGMLYSYNSNGYNTMLPIQDYSYQATSSEAFAVHNVVVADNC